MKTILLSGWGGSAEHMRTLAKRLELTDFMALSLSDLFDHGGQAASAAGKKSGSLYAAGLRHFLDQCGEPVNFIGWSTGGLAGIETAGIQPEAFRSMILLSATSKFCGSEDFPYGTQPAALRAMIAGLRRNPQKTVADFLIQAGAPLRMLDEQLQENVEDAMRQGVDILIHGLQYLKSSDYRDYAGAISCPCLIIHGKKDRIIPWQAADWLQKNLQRSEVLYYPRGGHLLLAQHGNEIVPKMSKFMDQVEV